MDILYINIWRDKMHNAKFPNNMIMKLWFPKSKFQKDETVAQITIEEKEEEEGRGGGDG